MNISKNNKIIFLFIFILSIIIIIIYFNNYEAFSVGGLSRADLRRSAYKKLKKYKKKIKSIREPNILESTENNPYDPQIKNVEPAQLARTSAKQSNAMKKRQKIEELSGYSIDQLEKYTIGLKTQMFDQLKLIEKTVNFSREQYKSATKAERKLINEEIIELQYRAKSITDEGKKEIDLIRDISRGRLEQRTATRGEARDAVDLLPDEINSSNPPQAFSYKKGEFGEQWLKEREIESNRLSKDRDEGIQARALERKIENDRVIEAKKARQARRNVRDKELQEAAFLDTGSGDYQIRKFEWSKDLKAKQKQNKIDKNQKKRDRQEKLNKIMRERGPVNPDKFITEIEMLAKQQMLEQLETDEVKTAREQQWRSARERQLKYANAKARDRTSSPEKRKLAEQANEFKREKEELSISVRETKDLIRNETDPAIIAELKAELRLEKAALSRAHGKSALFEKKIRNLN